MKLTTIAMWLRNPIGTYLDRRAVRKAELRDIENYLINSSEERATEGFPVQPIKQIKESAKRILNNREQNRTSTDIAQTIRDLRLGKKIRKAAEQQQKKQAQERGVER